MASIFYNNKMNAFYIYFIDKATPSSKTLHTFSSTEPLSRPLTQVAQHTGPTRAGARRILLTLEKLGYSATSSIAVLYSSVFFCHHVKKEPRFP